MILIVDDNIAMREIVKQYLKSISSNHDVKECGDGLEAVDAFRQFRPDWVLMDIKMPKMDGLIATKTICGQFPDARIVIISNFDDQELRSAANVSGAAGYVLKERLFELEELMR